MQKRQMCFFPFLEGKDEPQAQIGISAREQITVCII
jgi:hypothetical protein